MSRIGGGHDPRGSWGVVYLYLSQEWLECSSALQALQSTSKSPGDVLLGFAF